VRRDQRLGQVRAHEAVGAGYQHRPVGEVGAELGLEAAELVVRPRGCVAVAGHGRQD
jgi:hypothetical protein